MQRTVRLRALPNSPHPPYGLFVDPHRSRHTWWAVDSRALAGLVAVVGSLAAVLSVAAR